MNFISSHFGWMLGAAAAFALPFLLTKLPDWLASEEDKLLTKALEQLGPDDEELVLAMVKWAERKVPGSNLGHVKYRAVAEMVSARFPLISADKLVQMIESAVDKMKAVVEEKAKPKS